GRLATEGAVVVKVSKPQQDMRLDVPVIGMDTLKAMISVKARVLAVEAGRSIIIGRETMVSEAEKAGITIVGVRRD
ncbi:MAG: LpxI family protein, partial [Nitrospirales bacterium]|nr:LpxI family protein [Nitrospirales bacterium]